MTWMSMSRIAMGLCLVALVGSAVDAAVLCQHKKSGRAAVRADACKKKEVAVDVAALGLVGPPGADGADGQLRIYGDGSAGELTVVGNQNIDAVAPDGNFQFTSVTIAQGASLTVPSGTIFRSTGTFTNLGSISVFVGAAGSAIRSGAGDLDAGISFPAFASAERGVAKSAALSGELGDDTAARFGGDGGGGLTVGEARALLRPGQFGGGGGGDVTPAFGGGRGGGSLVVLAAGAIDNVGTIFAQGEDSGQSGGGGGGGVVILASPTQVSQGGTIDATGGDGGASFALGGNGGGGGGGIVHLVSPTIVTTGGTSDVAGGAGGSGATLATSVPRAGGGGGGGCGGFGGTGSGVNTNDTVNDGQDGSPGHVLESLVDPTALF